MSSLKRRTLGNLGLTAGTRVATLAMQLGANIVLARNLDSVDYGIVGYAQIFIAFLTMVSEFGLNSAAIQQRTLSAAGLRTGFTLRLCLGLAAFGLALIVAPLCGPLLDEPAVGDVIKLLAVGFLINALGFMPSVRMLRDLDYRKFVLAQLASAAVNTAVTVALAINGYAYWSIVVANVAAIAASVIVLNVLVRERMGLALDPHSVSHYARFGGHIFVAWMLTFVIMHLDDFVVGTASGPAALGYYALAFTWGAKLCETVGSVVNSVLFPTFSKIQDDPPRLRAAYLKSLQMVGFLAIGGYAVLALVSEDFLIEILGAGTEKWRPAVFALQILCVYGLIRTVLEAVGSVILAIGGVPLLVRANLFAAVVEVALVYPALKTWGIEGVAAVVTVSYACQYLVFVPALSSRLGVGVRELLRVLWQPAVAAAIAAGLVLALRAGSLTGEAGARFWIEGSLCAAAYLLAYGVVSRGAAYRELYNAVMSRAERT